MRESDDHDSWTKQANHEPAFDARGSISGDASALPVLDESEFDALPIAIVARCLVFHFSIRM